MVKAAKQIIAVKKKKSIKKAAKKTIKKTKPASKVSQASTGIKVEEIVHKVNPKLTLTDDAIELLNALLTEKFTQIAQAASRIVTQGH